MSQHHRSQKNEKSMPERGSSGPQVPDSAAKQFLNLSALAVREKAITLFLLIAIVAAGIFAFLKLGRAEDPTFTIKVFTVAAVWPGATAQEMQDIVGERPERIFVELSYERLATLGVSARDVFDALVRENAVTPSGSIDTKAQQVYIRLDGALDDLQKIRDTTVVSGGRTLKLSDIADVKRGYEDPATFLVRHNGQPALLLSIVMKEGWNGLDLGKALVAEQKKISTDLPAGISFSKVTDQAVNIREAVDEFMLKFFVALAVVMIVSIISLGWRVGIVVAAAVLLTLAAVFVSIVLSGRVFDRITRGALIPGLGLLVDDAIISIEIMVVKMEEGWDRIRAAGYAWSHTAAPMLAGTLVTVIGLMPVGFGRSAD